MGKGMARNHSSPHLMQFGRSMNLQGVQANITLLKDSASHWAAEGNISRPFIFSDLDLTPTLGVMSGEKRDGGYLRITGGNTVLGYASVSRYQT